MDWNKILQVKNVTKNYGKGESRTAALRGISFDVLEGEFLGIMGDSGSGKTTLLNCIATMTRPTSGEILLNGEDISAFKGARLAKYRGGKIGYLYQEFELLDNLTARENIVLPLALHGITQSRRRGVLWNWRAGWTLFQCWTGSLLRCPEDRSSAWRLPER